MGVERKEYVGQTANTFKMRYRGNVSDTNNKRKSTTLTTYILRRRREGLEPEMMRWSKVSLTEPRARGDRDCSLCTTEKVNIARGDPEVLLNRRSEIMKKCIHKDKLMLCNFQKMYEKTNQRVQQAGLVDVQEGSQQRDQEGLQEDEGGGEGGGHVQEGLQQSDQEAPQTDEAEEEGGGGEPEGAHQRDQEGLQADEGGGANGEGPRLRRRKALNYSQYF